MQLTGCHNGNEMRNATCADTQISIEWPYCLFPILWLCAGVDRRLGPLNSRVVRAAMHVSRTSFVLIRFKTNFCRNFCQSICLNMPRKRKVGFPVTFIFCDQSQILCNKQESW